MNMLPKRLKELREEKEFSQRKLAEELNFSHSSIASWENGKTIPNADIVCVLCKYFDISADYLLGLSDY